MSQLYTSGRWTVVPGREEEFVKAWSEMAEWSFGPWESAEAIAGWRESPGFQARVERIRGMLEGFEPGVFDCRVQVGAS